MDLKELAKRWLDWLPEWAIEGCLEGCLGLILIACLLIAGAVKVVALLR